jgi:hypothetical protein
MKSLHQQNIQKKLRMHIAKNIRKEDPITMNKHLRQHTNTSKDNTRTTKIGSPKAIPSRRKHYTSTIIARPTNLRLSP